jgi:4-hydroxy-tetrahydrodipicolinate reductase
MNLALIGHGRMGKEIEEIAREKNIKVVKIFEADNNAGGIGLTPEALKAVDVCIDFSTPATVLANIEAVAECGTNLVVGTTGWYNRIDHVKKLVKEIMIGFLYAPNFSLGVNIFTQVVMDAAHLFERYSEYDVAVHEIHHRTKADSPSGTALSLGATILQTLRRKSELLSETPKEPIKPTQLQVSSTRVGAVMGKHTVMFDSESDMVELVHTAKSRRGFALGAIVAAEWLKGKKGFYTMRDVILTK